MKKIVIALALIGAIIACKSNNQAEPVAENTAEEVSFETAKNYFFKNNQVLLIKKLIISLRGTKTILLTSERFGKKALRAARLLPRILVKILAKILEMIFLKKKEKLSLTEQNELQMG